MRAVISRVSPNSFVYSAVVKLYKPRVLTIYVANKYISWVAEYKNFIKMRLPSSVDRVSGCSYVEVNKLDTQRCHLFRGCILSRICRYI